MISVHEIAWTAGFLEAEGSFCMVNKAPFTTAVQVQKEPLERLQKYYGGKLRWYPNKWGGAWHWALCGVGLMMTLLPLMSPKRTEQIESVIAQWKTRRAQMKYIHACLRGHKFDEQNTYVWEGTRKCRKCSSLMAKERKAHKRGVYVYL